MIIRGIKFRAATGEGDFGFAFSFSRNLTILRASNSSGKSTLVNTLLYGLGMEELVGGKGDKALPYAVKSYIDHENMKVPILASEVWVEIENRYGNVVTLRRSIRDETRDSKLIEVFAGAHLTKAQKLGPAKFTYLHDSGAAQKEEGFHRFLEEFLGLALPQVATTSGSECKLYLQTIFAAFAVEQKRGWTDYIAGIPFYGIREAKTRVVEFLLNLDVFETNTERNRLNVESVRIDGEWRRKSVDFLREAQNLAIVIEGVSASPSASFDVATVVMKHADEASGTFLADYMLQLRSEYNNIVERSQQANGLTGSEALEEIDRATAQIQELSVFYERVTSSIGIDKAALGEYDNLLNEASEDLERNKAANKLRTLGANLHIEVASGHCPTCHHTIEDNLLSEVVSGPQMDLVTNIRYLESQSRMLKKQMAGLKESIRESELSAANLSARLSEKHDYLIALRGDMNSGALESRALVRRQVQIEVEMESLDNFLSRSENTFKDLKELAGQLKQNQAARRDLPKNAYSPSDEVRIRNFQRNFRANAGSFGYMSAPVSDIEISQDNLVPCLSQQELREIRGTSIKADASEIRGTNIKADSSASDFVRLIWSYLLALYQTSADPRTQGNHPCLLIFDEPGQHSMAVSSQRALLTHLSAESGLQSIVAASFDEMESVFQEVTSGVAHTLIQWDEKLIKRL